MKKIIITGVLFITTLSALFAFTNDKKEVKTNKETVECKYGQCAFTKKNYERCKNCMSNKYDTYCSSHD